jgi:hypothetical protein
VLAQERPKIADEPAPAAPPLQYEDANTRLVVTNNVVDQSLFDQRVSIRDAVKETAKIEATQIKNEQDLYNAPVQRLYADPNHGHRRVDPIQ